MRHPLRIVPARRLSWALALAPLLVWGHSQAGPPAAAQAVKEKKPDVIFVPTPQEVVDKMLEMAEVKKGDVLYDLGCGDGRIVATAAKRHGVKAVGIDIDPER